MNDRRYETGREHDLRGFAEERLGAPLDADAIVEQVATFTRENPHAALAGAAAIGFLLGGGLTPRLLGAVALIAGRRMIGQSIRDAIETALHGVEREA